MDINEKKIEQFKIKFDNIKNEIKKNIVGQDEIMEQVLIAILCEGNVQIGRASCRERV